VLPFALARCRGVQAVIFERLGGTFASPQDERQFQDDFRRLKNTVRSACHA
jgi:hypothetical protein